MIRLPENIHDGKKTIEYEIPWLVPESIFLLDRLLTKDMRVLEFGSGGSTLFFSKRVKSVLSFEHNPKWSLEILRVLNKKRITNVTLIFCTEEEIEDNFPTDTFNCILIDSNPRHLRGWLLKKSLPLLRDPKILVLDNYRVFRPDELTNELFVETYGLDYQKNTYNRSGWKGKGTRVFYN
jgi:predicted O-methyltransferase YrrM